MTTQRVTSSYQSQATKVYPEMHINISNKPYSSLSPLLNGIKNKIKRPELMNDNKKIHCRCTLYSPKRRGSIYSHKNECSCNGCMQLHSSSGTDRFTWDNQLQWSCNKGSIVYYLNGYSSQFSSIDLGKSLKLGNGGKVQTN